MYSGFWLPPIEHKNNKSCAKFYSEYQKIHRKWTYWLNFPTHPYTVVFITCPLQLSYIFPICTYFLLFICNTLIHIVVGKSSLIKPLWFVVLIPEQTKFQIAWWLMEICWFSTSYVTCNLSIFVPYFCNLFWNISKSKK